MYLRKKKSILRFLYIVVPFFFFHILYKDESLRGNRKTSTPARLPTLPSWVVTSGLKMGWIYFWQKIALEHNIRF